MINITHLRIKPLALDSGHGHYITVAYSRYKFVTVLLPKRLRNGRFTSETAVRRFTILVRGKLVRVAILINAHLIEIHEIHDRSTIVVEQLAIVCDEYSKVFPACF